MAENQYIVETKFTADTEEFKEGVKEVEQGIDKMNDALNQTGESEGAIDEVTEAISQLAKQLEDAAGDSKELAAASRKIGDAAAKAAIGDYKGALRSLKSGMVDIVQTVPEITKNVSLINPLVKAGMSMLASSAAAITGIFVSLAPAVIYAGEAIRNWVKSIGEARRTMIEMRHRVDDANNAINESGAAAAGSITKFKLLAQQWEQLTPEDKVAELETYRNELKKIGIAITDINDADNVFINNSERVIKALIARARAAGAEKLIADAESEKLLEEVKKEKAQERLKEVEELEKALGHFNGFLAVSSTDLGTNKSPFAEEIDRLRQNIAEADKEIAKHNEFISRIDDKYLEAAKEAKTLGEFASEATKEVEETTESVEESLETTIQAVKGSIAKYEEALKTARENYNNAATDEMRQYYAAEIAGIEQTIDALNRKAEAYLSVQRRAALGLIAPATAGINQQSLIGSNYGIVNLPAMETPAVVLNMQNAVREANEAMQEEAERWNDTINSMFGHAVADSISGGIEAITDAIMGVGDIDATSAIDAFLSPFADMSVRLGEMMVAMGVAESAFLSGFNPTQKIAAGVALIALGKLYKSAVESAGNKANGNAGYGNTWTGGGQLAAATNTPLQIEVYGTLSGQDIVLAGNNYTNNQRR
jgi:chromosome segregation ATPase